MQYGLVQGVFEDIIWNILKEIWVIHFFQHQQQVKWWTDFEKQVRFSLRTFEISNTSNGEYVLMKTCIIGYEGTANGVVFRKKHYMILVRDWKHLHENL
jgi:hypothetical protein